MMHPSMQEIQKAQGTRLSETSPWDSYENELTGQKMSPELAAQVADYAQKLTRRCPCQFSNTKATSRESRNQRRDCRSISMASTRRLC